MPPLKKERYLLRKPEGFLELFADGVPEHLDLDVLDVVEAWALVGLAALARENGPSTLYVHKSPASPVGRFAHALGFDDVVADAPPSVPGEPARTSRLRRIVRLEDVHAAATEIASLMVPEDADDESARTISYVLVESMRNAIQHSRDRMGGVVAAQRMPAGYPGYDREVVQVAVADAGIGILASLQRTFPELPNASAALVKALEPHVSGTFAAGQTGSAYNAGLGLFFISEMAKLTAGRLVLASRGATLVLTGDLEGSARAKQRFLDGFPGTLLAFELPLDEVKDHAGLIGAITDKARERAPRASTTRWVRFDAPDAPVSFTYVVSTLREDAEAAARFSREQLQPRLFKRESVLLDFRGVTVCTQSFLHALLYEAIRLSWATQTPIYVANAAPAVEVGVVFIDNYARGA